MRVRSAFAFSFLLLFATAAMAEKPVLAVLDFQNDTAAGWWYGGVGRDLAGMLTNELAGTGSFKMVERDKLSAVLDEQDLAASGRVDKKTGAKLGKMTGAQYLVTATLSAFEENVADTGGGLSFRGISVGGKKEDAYMAVDLRVINATTGEVEYTRTIEARATGGGLNLGLYRGGFGGNLSKHEKTPTGKAIRAAIMYISEYLSCAMVEKGECMDEFNAQEKSRKEKTKKSIKLD